jgi:hypothetical protein
MTGADAKADLHAIYRPPGRFCCGSWTWATAGESREQIVGLYHRVWTHSDATVDALAPNAIGSVRWWPPERSEVTLHRVLVHMITETHRHAGHADIVRDSSTGRLGCGRATKQLPNTGSLAR